MVVVVPAGLVGATTTVSVVVVVVVVGAGSVVCKWLLMRMD